jgi:hypothetical protein
MGSRRDPDDFLERLKAAEQGYPAEKRGKPHQSQAAGSPTRETTSRSGSPAGRILSRHATSPNMLGRASTKLALSEDAKIANMLAREPGLDSAAAREALARANGHVSKAMCALLQDTGRVSQAQVVVDPRDRIEDFEDKLRNMQKRMPAVSLSVLSDALIEKKGHAGKALFLVEKESGVRAAEHER